MDLISWLSRKIAHPVFLNDPQDLKHNIHKINIFSLLSSFTKLSFLDFSYFHSLTSIFPFFWFSADVYAFYFFEKKDSIKREVLNIARATSTNLHSSVSINHIISSVNKHKLPYSYLELIPPYVLGTYPYIFSYSKTILQNLYPPNLASLIISLYQKIPNIMQNWFYIFFHLKNDKHIWSTSASNHCFISLL